MNGDYVIMGDTERYGTCLVCVAGSTEELANKTLNRMLNNPTENDKKLMRGITNFRVEFAKEEECWWNWNCD